VKNAVSHFGIGTVVLSGGVAMNVKAMGKIASLPEVKRFFVAGTGSDESLALGATFCLAEDLAGGKEKLTGGKENSCSLYLGSWNTSEEEQAFLRGVRNDPAYEVVDKTTFEFIAELLAAPPLGRGLVLGRCAGAMEFGQRALGNRSIIADPINPAVVPRINQMIKNRDFWMPFAPVVLDSYSEKYLINPKRITSPHMTVGFETTSEGWKAMPAACHPADHTARAQILYHQDNPALYGLLQAFAEKTGRGAILNTSFNLHGYPIVNTIADGWDVFTKSGLDGLLLADSLVLKKRTQASGFEV
jgi:carbamoyltransferase